MSVAEPVAGPGFEPPRLSVVIASVNGWEVLEPTLEALDSQPERDQIEVIVVEPQGGSMRARLEARRPAVVLISVGDRLAIPRLRAVGVRRAQAPIIAILEDHGTVSPGWAAAVLKAHVANVGAVGGPVENGRSGLVNWAVFFCEYASYMGPIPDGEVADLPGNNIAYKRPHLWRHLTILDEGKWESWINDRLRADGVPLRSVSRMEVRHIKPFRLGHFLVQRFHFARSFAGMRRTEQSWGKRIAYTLGSLALPPLLLARITRTVVAKRRHLAWFVASLPLLALFVTAGAVGEMVGYASGPGRSLEQVE